MLHLSNRLNLPLKEAEAHEEVALAQRKLGNLAEATKASLAALSIYEAYGKHGQAMAIITQLANSQVAEGQYQAAIKGFNQAVMAYLNMQDTTRACLTLLNLGETYRLNGQLDSAAHYTGLSLKLNTAHDQIVHGYATGNLGLVHAAQGKPHSADSLLRISTQVLGTLGDSYAVSVYTFERGLGLVAQGATQSGLAYMRDAYHMAQAEQLKEQIRDFSAALATFYTNNGDYEQAYGYQKTYQIYKDSLVNIDNVRKIAQMKARHEAKQQEVKIGLLNRLNDSQQRMLWGLTISALLLLMLLGFLYRNYRQKLKANRTLAKREKEKALLLQELNHRTKNNLQMISSLLNLQAASLDGHPAADAVREGRYRVDSLALIHQKLYRTDFSKIDMGQYLEELVGHLRAGFSQNIRLDQQITPCAMDVSQAVPVALIANELITNAFKYGTPKTPEKPQVMVAFQSEGSTYSLAVQDNGPGMASPNLASLRSFGLKLVYSLVNQLNGDVFCDGSQGLVWRITFNHD